MSVVCIINECVLTDENVTFVSVELLVACCLRGVSILTSTGINERVKNGKIILSGP